TRLTAVLPSPTVSSSRSPVAPPTGRTGAAFAFSAAFAARLSGVSWARGPLPFFPSLLADAPRSRRNGIFPLLRGSSPHRTFPLTPRHQPGEADAQEVDQRHRHS